jgi:NAD-dependent deacetylase
MNIISPKNNPPSFAEAAATLRGATKTVALTGAGISVGSGIPDFRSPGGLWTLFSPEEYATLEVFYHHPAKAWELYRALGRVLLGKRPNPAHRALAELEEHGRLSGIVTQNVDGLHQQAGSRRVFEIHGDHQHLHCLQCDHLQALEPSHYQRTEVPRCPHCGFPLKPNVVLFGESVRNIEAIYAFIADCDLLLVIGTSAQVYPAAALPSMVRDRGGLIFEFNREQALSSADFGTTARSADFFFQGDVGVTLPMLVSACRSA